MSANTVTPRSTVNLIAPLPLRAGTPVERQRAARLRLIIWFALFGWTYFVFFRVLPDVLLSGVPWQNYLFTPALLSFPVLAASFYFMQRGRIALASTLFIAQFGYIALITLETQLPLTVLYLFAWIAAAAAVLDRRGLLFVAVGSLLLIVFRYVAQLNDLTVIRYIPADVALYDLLTTALYIALVVGFLYTLTGSAERAERQSMREIRELRAVSSYSGGLPLDERLTEEAVTARALLLLQDDLGYDLAQFYLPQHDDAGDVFTRLRLNAGTHELAAPSRVRVGDESAIGETRRTLQTIVVNLNDAQPRIAHLVPPSRQGIIVPITTGETLIGVLDVQTISTTAPSLDQILALEALGEQLGRAIDEARALNDLRRTVADQEQLLASLRARLLESQQRGQQVISDSWTRYVEGRGGRGFGFDAHRERDEMMVIAASDLSQDIREAFQRDDLYVKEVNDTQYVGIPVRFRGEVLGAMQFSLPAGKSLNERQIELARTVANRLGVALENNRLFEQSQAQAVREKKASDVASLLITATDVDAVLSLAADSFNEALGGVFTRITLDPNVLLSETFSSSRGASDDDGHASVTPALRHGNGHQPALNGGERGGTASS